MLRILHLADLHLGWTPRFMPAPRASLRREARDSLLSTAVDFACDPANGIDLLVIAGDLFETHTPDAALVGRVIADLERLPVPVVTTPGNHDEITYAASVYRRVRWPGVLVTEPHPSLVTTLHCDDTPVHVYSLAYVGGVTPTRPSIRHFPRVESDGVHLAVFHGTLGEWGGDRSLPLEVNALAEARYDYVALGHIHKHTRHRLGGGLAVYPGMVCGKGFDDPGVGHLTVAEIDRGTVRLTAVPVANQTLRTVGVDVTPLPAAEALEEALLRLADPSAMLRVRLVGSASFPIDADQLASQLADGFFHLEVVDETFPVTDASLQRWASDDTVLGLFIRRVQTQLAAASADRRPLLEQALQRGIVALQEGKSAT